MTLILFSLGIGFLLLLIVAMVTLISDPRRVDEAEREAVEYSKRKPSKRYV